MDVIAHPVSVSAAPAARIVSVDAYRGLVMALIFGEVLSSCVVSAALPSSELWATVCGQQTHVAWVGMSLHDVIQPSFFFLVGLALWLSRARKQAHGKATSASVTAFRSIVLIVLGMALVAVHPRQWDWYFVDTLTQIGLAYPFLVMIAERPKRDWAIAMAVILVGYWLWFALYPLPPATFDYAAVGVSPEWLRANGLSGFAAHWQKNSNASWAFDHWFLNLFHRDAPHLGYTSGLTTLNFIPSIATMVLGLVAADVLRSSMSAVEKLRRFCQYGVVLIVAGWALGALGIVPVVKAIWTPSWVLFSGGVCMLMLAVFYGAVDVLGYRRSAFPLKVIGMNSIVAYCMYHVYPALAFNSFRRLLGGAVFLSLGAAYEPMLYGAVVFLAYWTVLYALYRFRVFVHV